MSRRNRITTAIRTQPQDGLKDLVNKSFQIYTATPLRGLQLRDSNLIRYENSLSIVLCASMSLSRAPDASGNDGIHAGTRIKGELQLLRFGTSTLEDWIAPVPAIYIIVKIKPHNSSRVNESYFYLIPRKQEPDEEPDIFPYYPIVLTKANYLVNNYVSDWFMRTFDCRMVPLQVRPQHIERTVEWWCTRLEDLPPTEEERVSLSSSTSRSLQKMQLELVYAVPQISGAISDICITIKVEELINIYGVIRASKKKVMDAIHEHIFNTTRVKISALPLARAGTPFMFLAQEGKIKFMDKSRRADILKVLEDLCEWSSEMLL